MLTIYRRVIEEKLEKKFAGKYALVIGGTGGIGCAVAIGLAEEGASLTVCGGTNRVRLVETVSHARSCGVDADGFLCAFDEPDAVERILERCPAPDILVYAYGPFKRVPIEDMSSEDWRFLVTNNLIMPGILVSSVLKTMISHTWGRILLFGGTNTDTIRGFSSTAAYSGAKTGLAVIAKSVAKTAGRFGVTCNMVCPGLTDTEYTDETSRAYNHEKNILTSCKEKLSPEAIARAGLFVLKDPSINGAIIPVDQGVAV